MKDEDFRKIFLEYYSQLCNFALRYVHDNDVVEDIVQDVFCRLIEDHSDVRWDTLRSYLYQSTRNKSIDYLRNANNQTDTLNDDNARILDEYVDQIIINRGEQNVDYEILLNAVYDIISSFSPRTKEVFLMSRRQNLSNKEIAERLQISVKAVEKHITQALSVLRKDLVDDKLITFFFVILLFS